MKSFGFVWCLLFGLVSSAQHREHGAHSHGSAEASLAFDGAVGKFDFKSPSDSIIGFEHEAKSAKDKKSQAQGLNLLSTKISEIIVFDTELKCKFAPEKIEVVREAHENHSDTKALFSITCLKSPVGSKIVFNFQKYFPKLKDVDIQILVDSIQKSLEAQKSGSSVELK